MFNFLITNKPIDSASLANRMRDPAVGAFVAFEGWVRNTHDGHAVSGLEYEAFAEMVVTEGRQILNEASQRYAIADAQAVHRTGSLTISDCAIWVGVTAVHRQEAFLACRWIMDAVKERLPVWKKEFFVMGEPIWVHAASGSASKSIDAAQLPYYQRQINLSILGEAGQRKLAQSRVLVIGAGGLGCPALQYLTGAGVGHLTIVDGDTVEESNLHRQILFGITDIGRNKATTAAERLRMLNPNISLCAVDDAATAETLPHLLKDCDVVLDGTDNFESKYMVHDFAWQSGVPIVQASVYQLDGLIQVFDPRQPQHGCFRCLWPEPPPPGAVCNCAEAGVLGVTSGLLGVWQAAEALKLLLDAPEQLGAETLHVNVLEGTTFRLKRELRSDCSCRGIIPWARLSNQLLYPGKIARDLRAKAITVDLREPEEIDNYPSGMAKCIHAPQSDWSRLPEYIDSAPVVLCCAGGVRARQCLDQLEYPENWYAWTRSIQEWVSLRK